MINEEVIKEIIAENNYLPEVVYTSKNFSDEYGLSVLKNKAKNRELLQFMFGSKSQNNQSLTYRLEFDSRITNYFGAAKPGYSHGRILNYKDGSWRNKGEQISEKEAIELAYKIRTGIVNTLEKITEKSSAVDIYQLLKKNNVPSETWVKKYFTILYPDKFMLMLNKEWIDKIFSPIGLKPVEDWYENSRFFCDRAKAFGLDGITFYHAIAKALNNDNNVGNQGDTDNLKQPVPGSTLLNEIIEALRELGGKASLKEIYKQIEERDNIPSIHEVRTWKESIRATIYTHSTDSLSYREGYQDVFESIGGKRSGQWKLREGNISDYKVFEDDIPDEVLEENAFDKSSWKKWEEKRNLIVFGAPGTGKSYKLNNKKVKLIGENNVDQFERVTFHPEYSYASFVGVYKPTPVSDDKDKNSITYEFVPGPFMRMYVKAKQNPDKPYILVIEEINRSNTAAVFGDIFQLLDRDSNYESEYEIAASKDIQDFLDDLDKTFSFDDNSHSIIKIPGNLFIWATMNSADQGVYPMDSAFKRRWSFEYVDVDDGYNSPIADGSPYSVKNSKFIISINGKEEEIYWNDLRCEINNQLVSKLNVNEDKLLGAFFIKVNESDGSVSLDDIKYKVLMYLFDDVARHRRTVIFRNTTSRFSEIIAEFEKKGLQVFNEDVCDKYRRIHPEPSGEN